MNNRERDRFQLRLSITLKETKFILVNEFHIFKSRQTYEAEVISVNIIAFGIQSPKNRTW
uniref:Uncharacterized protein n=1 Tax=Anguilla anguilla TaxID=7936 RepID=A0A0E9PFI8_ANGAN